MITAALAAAEPSDRLQAALTAGTHPDDSFLDPLVERCAVEPDFYVRDMLTWALTRLPPEPVLPREIDEPRAPVAPARSQALRPLPEHLHDSDIEVARAAWRTAAGLVPHEDRPALARELALELGRGDLDAMRSLSRAFVELEETAIPALEAASIGDDEPAARHARATLRLIEDPGATFVLD